jgi:hypothetical protein
VEGYLAGIPAGSRFLNSFHFRAASTVELLSELPKLILTISSRERGSYRGALQLGSICGVHPTQVTTWKRQLVAEAAEIFTRGGVYDKEAIEQERRNCFSVSAGRKVPGGIGLDAKTVGDLATLKETRIEV